MFPEFSVGSTSSTVTISFERLDCDRVLRFQQQHCHPTKAEQVYFNTLAVSAVDFYLRHLKIETDLAASCTHCRVYQTLMDIADLEIPNVGQLECRPVLPGANVVSIPPEVWTVERIGYVGVQIDDLWEEATLLGFTTIVPESGELPLTQLQAIAKLPAHIQRIRQAKLN
ncbi:MAG: hypothetical protein CLLPBCKN_006737 [Chroococcidiopsis cubana SAG 39.79]|uniref:Uncharacterized protein n=1 Tax=Chroococcidiopsis cubana SAG 39.79 TaxID=388085 RepID=A0AB37UDT2_9CYAN|nr:DUF1822 family protein [Chroococcidiopsis cubana]MDZ4877302.1 hypothetical protein [Chroococcidiopsis cubana SAG 39.79]PSB60409.1 hypothetical protein C7B79_25830 [Chroococcidiopsis cubana CCALA 043]RUT05849.1 hypothetical protein DSM107010_53790 [Chroococcidiopsis cubana SAG 39.79]